MSDITVNEGDLIVRGARIALLVSRFNGFVVESLLARRNRCPEATWRG